MITASADRGGAAFVLLSTDRQRQSAESPGHETMYAEVVSSRRSGLTWCSGSRVESDRGSGSRCAVNEYVSPEHHRIS